MKLTMMVAIGCLLSSSLVWAFSFYMGNADVKEFVGQSIANCIRENCTIALFLGDDDDEHEDEVLPWHYAFELGLERHRCIEVLKGDLSLADNHCCFFYCTLRENLEFRYVLGERPDVTTYIWKGKRYNCRGKDVWKFEPPYDPFRHNWDGCVRLMFVTPERILDTSRIKLVKPCYTNPPYHERSIAGEVKGDVMKMSSDELMRALKLESVFSNRVYRLNEGGVFQVDYDVPQLKGRVLRKEAQKCLEYAKEANNSLMHLSADEVSEIVYLAYAADGDSDGTRYAAAAQRCPKLLKPFKPPFKTEIGRRVYEALGGSRPKPTSDSHGDGREGKDVRCAG